MIGETLGHYRVLEKIGEGGMGVVYRAHDERLDRDVALKVLTAGTLGDDTARKRLRREALALGRLNHPHIEAVYDFDSEGAVDFLVMEHVPGPTLADRLTSGALDEPEVLRLGQQLAAALEEAHGLGVVHHAGPDNNGSQFFVIEGYGDRVSQLYPRACAAPSGLCCYTHFGEGVCGCELVPKIAAAGNSQTRLVKVTISRDPPTCK